MRFLIAGWFSFEQMGATAGDLMARDLVGDWLEELGIDYDLATAAPFEGGLDWSVVPPERYTHVVFVCGPFGNGWPVTEFLARFAECRLIGVNLSMLQDLDEWNPFDYLIERDSSRATNPDITFLSEIPNVSVVGVVKVHPQTEYSDRALHHSANSAIDRLLIGRKVAIVPIDTRLDENSGGLRNPSEVESLIARMDVVVTTRLHGTVLALKNGVPVLPIDPISGGAKITRQVQRIDWPILFTADKLDDDRLNEAFDYCIGPEGKLCAARCAREAKTLAVQLREQFMTEFRDR